MASVVDRKTNAASSKSDDRREDHVSYIAAHLEASSGRALRAKDDADGGILAVAGRRIRRGELVLECAAACTAIDPQHRRSRCAYCAEPTRKGENDNASTTFSSTGGHPSAGHSGPCHRCGVVSVCDRCRLAGAERWHVESGECCSLAALVRCYAHLFVVDADKKSIPELAENVESPYVMVTLLLFRRWRSEIVEGGTSVNNAPPVDDNPRLAKAVASTASSPIPPVDWKLFSMLHTTKIAREGNGKEEQGCYDSAIDALCKLIQNELTKTKAFSHHDCSWFAKKEFDDVLGKVTGCSHAITDVSLQLGCQCLGQALFLSHSFYNHCCSANAFLSCLIGASDRLGVPEVKKRKIDQTKRESLIDGRGSGSRPDVCSLVARVHCLEDVDKDEAVTLSYIPTSGLDRVERQQRLRDNYHFLCRCKCCCGSERDALKVPMGSDTNSLREVQYACNQRLLRFLPKADFSLARDERIDLESGRDDELEELKSCLGMIRMCGNGIVNQGIPPSHEVSIELHRLLALALSLLGRKSEAIDHHRHFFKGAEPVSDIFDPVARATQSLVFSLDLEKTGDLDEQKTQLTNAMELSRVALGADHPFAHSIEKRLAINNGLTHRSKKKGKRASCDSAC